MFPSRKTSIVVPSLHFRAREINIIRENRQDTKKVRVRDAQFPLVIDSNFVDPPTLYFWHNYARERGNGKNCSFTQKLCVPFSFPRRQFGFFCVLKKKHEKKSHTASAASFTGTHLLRETILVLYQLSSQTKTQATIISCKSPPLYHEDLSAKFET